jgi:hypothetical protein
MVERKVPLYLDEDRSGTVICKVPRRLEDLLKRRARLNGRSYSAEIRLALALSLEGTKKEK